MKPVLVFSNRQPLAGLSRDQFIDELVRRLRGRVEAAYLFGSFVRDHLAKDSDVDVILALRTDEPFLDRAMRFVDLQEIGPRLDLLVYTPDELNRLIQEPLGYWKSVRESMVRIV
jgi:uncharacterized protein